MRIIFLILMLILAYNFSDCQKITLNGSVEKYQDPYERSYYPIWSGDVSYYLSTDTTKYVQASGWGDADKPTFIYVNLTLNINSLWLSINPFRSDIYNPTIQLGYTFQIFHPPR